MERNPHPRPGQRDDQRTVSRPNTRPVSGQAPRNISKNVNAERDASSPVKKQDDYAGLKFLAAMLVVALVLCGGIYGVFMVKQTVDEHSARQASNEPATVNVTFPEGRTVRQYGELLENNGVCSADAFYSEMRETEFTEDYSFLPSNDILQQREYPLEGYLYPDTYTFYVGENPKSVIKRFLNNFAVRVSEEAVHYADSNGEGFTNIKMSFDKAVILASIIERESPDDTERDKISAVFWNRMERPAVSGTGGKLQSDATHYYPYVVTDAPEGFRSEYDTYDITGLPKGPICSPSASSIRAAVYPDATCKAYFFFNDKKGNHYYAETYEQHLKNIQYCKDNGLA